MKEQIPEWVDGYAAIRARRWGDGITGHVDMIEQEVKYIQRLIDQAEKNGEKKAREEIDKLANEIKS